MQNDIVRQQPKTAPETEQPADGSEAAHYQETPPPTAEAQQPVQAIATTAVAPAAPKIKSNEPIGIILTAAIVCLVLVSLTIYGAMTQVN
ncbi:MAG: hypothetical protein ACR2FM_04050 [Candidatus Saccharimonadales bacterium]